MRVYDKDFKEEAIKLSNEIGNKAAAEKLGIPETTLYTWKTRTKQYGEIAFVGSGHKRVDPKTADMKAMEKKIKELEDVNDILKRALGFFAVSQKK
ncbi:transposase [Heliophilum fasciatum]|uniref:Transposase n=1 Tax=Heliophilum fasciatum TaxID=35700 RepID=A0A4R2R9I5_9FIRM|nr:transposase [Heliophilum fasciatum]MCW2279517.1 transposase [Heliophilum fasciatum]TCP58617.1 transposase [Heliophilum fasciatum]